MSDLRQLQSHEWSISTSFHEIETGYFQHQFCKAFLLRAFMGRCNAEHFQVLRVMGRDKDGYALRPPTVHDTDEDEFLSVSDPILEATVLFDGQAYDLVVATVS